MNTDTDTDRDVPTVAAPIATYSHIASPSDARCQWWQRIASEGEVLAADPATVDGAGDLPGRYVRKGSDHELAAWTIVFDGEALHHRKQRGWRHLVGIVAVADDGTLSRLWMPPTAERKAAIKATGASHLMGGSGPNAAMVRIARYVLEGSTDADRRARLSVMLDAR